MALLDLQAMEPPADAQGGGGSTLSVTTCDKHSSQSLILCL
ncbi:MAG: SapB/AmfS family lantipeptide [Streptosporangiales bacterium]|nr:SapB/AmfS family lantipeptide [Streptosporangiales bacterium]